VVLGYLCYEIKNYISTENTQTTVTIDDIDKKDKTIPFPVIFISSIDNLYAFNLSNVSLINTTKSSSLPYEFIFWEYNKTKSPPYDNATYNKINERKTWLIVKWDYLYFLVPPKNYGISPLKNIIGLTFLVNISNCEIANACYGMPLTIPDLFSCTMAHPNTLGYTVRFDSVDNLQDVLKEKLLSYIYQYKVPHGFEQTFIYQRTYSHNLIDDTTSEYYDMSSTYLGGALAYTVSNVTTSAYINTCPIRNIFHIQDFLYVETHGYQILYKTQHKLTWLDVASAVGGMYSTISSPLWCLTGLLLYTLAFTICNYKFPLAPRNPLDEDIRKRLDVYIVDLIEKEKIQKGKNCDFDDTKVKCKLCSSN